MTEKRPTLYEGGCHCGAVRFRVEIERHEAVDCDCSICTKKGYLHLIVAAERFELLQGAEVLSTYSFNTHTAQHHFCKVCGIASFYIPRSHPEGVDVNLRCLDGDVAERFELRPFEGRSWETHVHEIR